MRRCDHGDRRAPANNGDGRCGAAEHHVDTSAEQRLGRGRAALEQDHLDVEALLLE